MQALNSLSASVHVCKSPLLECSWKVNTERHKHGQNELILKFETTLMENVS